MERLIVVLMCLAVLFTFGFSSAIAQDQEVAESPIIELAPTMVVASYDVRPVHKLYAVATNPLYVLVRRPVVLVPGQIVVRKKHYRTPVRNKLLGKYRITWSPAVITVPSPRLK